MGKKLDVFQQGISEDFDGRIAAPASAEQASQWLEQNRNWWNSHPMRYDWTESLDVPEFSKEYFEEIDRRFLKTVHEAHPWKQIPFDDYIDFEWIRDKKVLEIGTGCGTHAQLLASHAGAYTGIDLTDFAVRATGTRLAINGFGNRIRQMNAENLEFEDSSFDFVWSWGVIHHSSNTRRILKEIWRVLKPGGRCTVMVYHRSWWNTLVRGGFYYGLLRGGFLRGLSVHRLIQETTDGALARYYTRDEWLMETQNLFSTRHMSVIGHKTQVLPLPAGRLKNRVGDLIPDAFGRWLTNRPLFGYMIVPEMVKLERKGQVTT
jgi:ubiquinone/menaquinone biosynthesis C-methylase UbiE